MPDDPKSIAQQLPVKVPNWFWGAVLLGGGGSLGAGGMGFLGEPAATKVELAAVEDKVEALDDKIDDRMDRLERMTDRISFALGTDPIPTEAL